MTIFIVIWARALRNGLGLVLPALVFGFLVAAQWRTTEAPAFQELTLRYTDPLANAADKLQGEQDLLKAQLAELRARLDVVQRAAAAQGGAAKELQTRVDDLRAQAGLSAARGEGLVVTLDAGRAAPAKEAERICYAPDLTDIVNAAWRGGASAVAVNGERLVSSTGVYCVGATIIVNGSLVAQPFEVTAVGPPVSVLAVLDDPAQLRDLKRRRDANVVDLRVTRGADLAVPAYNGTLAVRFAKPQ